VADGWLPSCQGDWAKLTELTTRLDDAVAAAARAPADLHRVLNIGEPGSDPAATAVDQVVPRVRQVAAARR